MTSSPTCRKGLPAGKVLPASNDDNSICKTSPTRVFDFGVSKVEETRPTSCKSTRTKRNNAPSAHCLVSPEYAPSPSFRRSRQSLHVLPTLIETSIESDSENINSSFINDALAFPKLDHSYLLCTKKQAENANKKLSVDGKQSHFERMNDLLAKARSLTDSGLEEEGLDVYRNALRINAAKLARVKVQMNEADRKHPSTVESIHLRLLEDWSKIGLSLGDIRVSMAIVYERLGHYKQAIACCNEAQYTYERHPTLSGLSFDGVSVQELVQKADAIRATILSAKSTFRERKDRYDKLFRVRSKAAVTGDSKLLRKAQIMATEIKALEISSLGENHTQVAGTCTVLSELAVERNDKEMAIAYAKEAVRINERSLGDKHPQTGHSFAHLARLYAESMMFVPSVDLFIRAVDIFRSLKVQPKCVGSMLNEIALILLRNDRIDDAIRFFCDALSFYRSYGTRSAVEGVYDDLTSYTANVWRALARCYFQTKQYKDSARALVNLLNIQRNIRTVHEDSLVLSWARKDAVEKPPPELAADESIADTLRRLGKAYRRAEMYQEARPVLKEAALISRIAVSRLVAGSKGRLNSLLPAKEDEFASDLYLYAKVCSDLEDFDEASKVFGESLEVRLFSDAHRQGFRANMVHCCMCLVGMGDIHLKKGEREDARRVYEDALTYCSAHGKLCWRIRENDYYMFQWGTHRLMPPKISLRSILFIR
jgi:tetratricopeptide (TPR) repeat protein